jgi:microsomal dipeptidase-like Zn-dependent dipeptidase
VDTNDGLLIVDALQYSRPERPRFEEWRAGGIGCVHVTLAVWENARDTLRVIGNWHRLFDRNADLIAHATSVKDIERIAKSGRTAVVFGFQNASPFEDDIELVRIFHKLGVRIVQLTYNVQNHVACGCWEDNDTGLSTFFGRNVVREMNEVGMLVDLSHCGERTCLDAIDFSAQPVAITHANPAEFVGDDIELKRRTKSTEVIRRMAAQGGVIGLGMYPPMTRGGSSSTLEGFCDMVAWTCDLVGVDAVGFGTDFYAGYPESEIMWWRAGRWARESAVPIKGFPAWPAWFRSPAAYPGVIKALRGRGFSDPELAKISGRNWLRLFDSTFGPKR